MTFNIKTAIEAYFLANWSTTTIQYEGTVLDTSSLTKYISLVYNPVLQETYGFDGTACGRIRTVAIQKVFCYAKNPNLAYQLADTVKTFLNGIQIGASVFDVGQDRTAINVDDGFYEVLVETNLINYN